MKYNHDGDCTIYSALINGRPEDGICTCGYALQQLRDWRDCSKMYSSELLAELERKKSQKIIDGLENITERRSN